MNEPTEFEIAANLRKLIETLDVANMLTDPLMRSIINLLETSAAEINSAEASVLVRDGEEGDLKFLAAIGSVAEQLLSLKVPAGKGIAGFVMSSGQPVAVSDAGSEQSFYSEVDAKTGYSTQMILATPLRHNGEITGVLEYINRRGDAPLTPFSPDEMNKAAVFADAVASLVNAYESAALLRELADSAIKNESNLDIRSIRSWLEGVRSSADHREMIDLAVLVRDISSRGEAERQMCREILEAVLRYSDSKTDTNFLSY